MKSFATLLALVSAAAATPLAVIDGAQHSLNDYANYPGFEGYSLSERRLVQLAGGSEPVWMTELEKVRFMVVTESQ
jgi:hypothetical protein